MRQHYVSIRFSAGTRRIIDQVNEIIEKYSGLGFTLTLRQLYYQFVSRDLIPNSLREYKRLGSIVNDGRLAGLIDWLAIEDRTRATRSLSHWDHPGEIIESAAYQYRVDKWENQEYRPVVWIEKDALVGVIEKTCDDHDVPYLSCRGYTSQSEMWNSARTFLRSHARGQTTVVLHLGDHDPSGLDMTRDITDRLSLFTGGGTVIRVERLALNYDQVEKHRPPPNPAKTSDARFRSYAAEFGESSWELDALEPSMLSATVAAAIARYRDDDAWAARVALEEAGRARLRKIAKTFNNKKGE